MKIRIKNTALNYIMKISKIDHLVLTVASTSTTCAFYERVLGMQAIEFADNRKALTFGRYKLNLHEVGKEFEPKAKRPVAGSADLCLITDSRSEDILCHLNSENINIEEGPVQRTGANGAITSFYIRDPDENLIEIATYADK